jgi:hypothetical protein
LDEVQSGDDPLSDVIVMVDMCYAGGFVRQCANPNLLGARRVLVASTNEERLANFGGTFGQMSFSSYFLSAAIQGSSIRDAFLAGAEAMRVLRTPPSAPQLPILDDDGDGVYTGLDGYSAGLHNVGTAPVYGNLPPELVATAPNQFVPSAVPVSIWAEVGPSSTDAVTAYLTFDDQVFAEGQPITSFTTIELVREGVGSRWSALVPPGSFPYKGFYTVVYTASKQDDAAGGYNLQSQALSRSIQIAFGPDPSPGSGLVFWMFE